MGLTKKQRAILEKLPEKTRIQISCHQICARLTRVLIKFNLNPIEFFEQVIKMLKKEIKEGRCEKTH